MAFEVGGSIIKITVVNLANIFPVMTWHDNFVTDYKATKMNRVEYIHHKTGVLLCQS